MLNLWVLRQLLLPLAPFPALIVTAALIAFLLDIPSRWLRQRGLPRPLATAMVLAVALALLGPRLIEQLGDLIAELPRWISHWQVWLNNLEDWATQQGLPPDFGTLSSDLLARLSKLATQFSQRVLGLLGATVGLTINTLIVLVLALALWLPPGVRLLVTDTFGRTFRGYFAGQVLFAVAIGFTTLVPFASLLTTLLVSGLLALNDPPKGLKVLAAITVGLPGHHADAPAQAGPVNHRSALRCPRC